MQQSQLSAQRLYQVVLSISSHRSIPADTPVPAQRVIAPICRRGVSAAHR